MVSRRVLASIADGVAAVFLSRNNDVDGWWAPGLLIDAAAPADPAYSVDLLTGATVPATITSALDQLGPALARYFAWSLDRSGLPAARVASASLKVRFLYEESVPSWRFGRTDRPFACTVTITDDHGRAYQRQAFSHCTPLSAFDFSEAPASYPARSGGPHDRPRIAQRVDEANRASGIG
jgi:hypothetical protein